MLSPIHEADRLVVLHGSVERAVARVRERLSANPTNKAFWGEVLAVLYTYPATTTEKVYK